MEIMQFVSKFVSISCSCQEEIWEMPDTRELAS